VSEVYSHSRLSSFEKCPKQFHFRYVLRVPRETEGIEAFVGKRVHEVLERLYRFVDRGLVPSLSKVLHRYFALWDEHYEPVRVRVARAGTPSEHYRGLGARCLENYYRRHYPFDRGETLGLEEHVAFPLDEAERYRFQGIVDRISLAPDGAIEIHDYKTGARVPRQSEVNEDRQLALYQLGVARRWGEDRPVRLFWHYVAHGQQLCSTRTPEQLQELRRQTIGRIDEIRAESEWRPRPSPLCGWCEYRALCPAFADERSEAPARRAPPPQPRAIARAVPGRAAVGRAACRQLDLL
jgi:putative RecB family exonuclease